MKTEYLISIVVPVYNVERYLADCVESVRRQRYENWECVLVDDGSTDESGTICERYSQLDSRIVVVHKKNGGLSSARNAGSDRAKGDYVVFLDSDDFWVDDSFLFKINELINKFTPDVIRCEYLRVDENGITIGKEIDRNIPHSLCDTIIDSEKMYVDVCKGENFAWLFIFNKTILETTKYDETVLFQEDIAFNIHLFKRKLRCVYSPIIFYAYRERQNSLMTTPKVRNLACSFRLAEEFASELLSLHESRLKQEYKKNSIMMYVWTLMTLAAEPYYSSRRQIIRELKLNHQWLKVVKRCFKYRFFNKYIVIVLLCPLLSTFLYNLLLKLK